jgi:hypothetical protein
MISIPSQKGVELALCNAPSIAEGGEKGMDF